MGVFRNVTFAWGGETFDFVPSFALLERVEDIIPISKLAMDLGAGNSKVSTAARLVHVVAKSAGIAVTVDDVYQVMAGLDPADRVDLLVGVIDAFTPKAVEGGKKPVAQLEVGPKE